VRNALRYRQSKGNPLTREDIQIVNDLLLRVGFKIPELRNPKFLDGLPSVRKTTAAVTLSDDKRKGLLAQLHHLSALDPQARGYAFEEFLKGLFSLSNLAPRSAFRLVGEQIDGSFALQGETYLLEATWRNTCIGEEELLYDSTSEPGPRSQVGRQGCAAYSTLRIHSRPPAGVLN
jgi:hypothetical protein